MQHTPNRSKLSMKCRFWLPNSHQKMRRLSIRALQESSHSHKKARDEFQAARWREVGFHPEIHSEIAGQIDVVDIYNIVDVELWNDAKMQMHQGKTHVWNRG